MTCSLANYSLGIASLVLREEKRLPPAERKPRNCRWAAQAWPGQATEQRCQTGHPEENLRHKSHSPDITIGHCTHRDPTKHPTRSSLPGASDPCQRSSRHSIPIGHALGNGLVQPIFSPPSRRSPSDCFPSLFPPRRRPKNALRYDGLKLGEAEFVLCGFRLRRDRSRLSVTEDDPGGYQPPARISNLRRRRNHAELLLLRR